MKEYHRKLRKKEAMMIAVVEDLGNLGVSERPDRWRTTISGFPHSVDIFEQRFTERLESVRKDVE